MKLGTLKEIKNLRTVWSNEAQDFTPWLAEDENLALLADAVGIDITLEETESGVGDFNVDIFASETGTDRKIIIENQLEETNHDHLGKLITYASGKSADILIWVVKKAREEHRAAVEWLNHHTDDKIAIFLVEIKLYQIGNSDPAIKFEVVEKPNDWTKEIKKQENQSITSQKKYDYWCAFNDYAFQNAEFSKAFKKRKASSQHWMNFGIGLSSCNISISQIRKYGNLIVELYISDDKELYRKLHSNKREIEAEMGMTLEWWELPEKKASRIISFFTSVDFEDKSKWCMQFDWAISTAIKMKKVFKQYL